MSGRCELLHPLRCLQQPALLHFFAILCYSLIPLPLIWHSLLLLHGTCGVQQA